MPTPPSTGAFTLKRLARWLRRALGGDGRSAPGGAMPGVPYRDAVRREKAARPVTLWPKRTPGNRLQPHAWPVVQPRFDLSQVRSIFAIGSCFARNIEEELEQRGYEVLTRAFSVPASEWPGRANGILNKFAPTNIWQELEWTVRVLNATPERREALFAEPLLELPDGSVVDMELAGLAPVTRERGMERRRQLFELNRRAFSCDLVVITPGLCEVWWDRVRRRHVEQVPPASIAAAFPGRFEWRMLGFVEAHACLTRAIELVARHGRPGCKVMITVSPAPLKLTFTGEDALIANTWAKSTLRSAVGQIAAERADVAYFPSYESVTLSTAGDIWANDLRHLSPDFVSRIVDRLVAAYFSARSGAER